MEFKYNKIGDYYIPDIQAPINNTNYKIGRFGRLRENYLKENKPSIYNHLLMTGKLQQDIIQTDKDAKEQLEILINQLKEKENSDENLKNTDPLTWVGKMNSIKKQAEEIVINEIIFNQKY